MTKEQLQKTLESQTSIYRVTYDIKGNAYVTPLQTSRCRLSGDMLYYVPPFAADLCFEFPWQEFVASTEEIEAPC